MSAEQQHVDLTTASPTWENFAGSSGVIALPKPPVIQFNGDGGNLIVAIHPDGTIELGPGVSNDDAARAFWDAVTRLAAAQAGGWSQ